MEFINLEKILKKLFHGNQYEKVLILRFGLFGNSEHTLNEVGKVFGVGRERVRQIEAKALRIMRMWAGKNKVEWD